MTDQLTHPGADPDAKVSVVIPQADRLPIADRFAGLFAADQVLYRYGEVLRHLSADRPVVGLTMTAAVAKRAALSFAHYGAEGKRLAKYFDEAK